MRRLKELKECIYPDLLRNEESSMEGKTFEFYSKAAQLKM